jgi:hypothetical protein
MLAQRMKLALLLIWLAGSGVWLCAQPAQIVLLRHAEKPADPQALHLSKQGRDRAKALPEFFQRSQKVSRFGSPVALFASCPTRHGHGQRPQETLGPLAKALRLPIQTPYESEQYALLAYDILHHAEFSGKTVVICWVHEQMPQFAAALGVSPEPPKWKEDVYDRAYVITYDHGKATLDVVRQKLLPGDSKFKQKD